MWIYYRAMLVDLSKLKKYAKQPGDSKYLHIQVINRIAAK